MCFCLLRARRGRSHERKEKNATTQSHLFRLAPCLSCVHLCPPSPTTHVSAHARSHPAGGAPERAHRAPRPDAAARAHVSCWSWQFSSCAMRVAVRVGRGKRGGRERGVTENSNSRSPSFPLSYSVTIQLQDGSSKQLAVEDGTSILEVRRRRGENKTRPMRRHKPTTRPPDAKEKTLSSSFSLPLPHTHRPASTPGSTCPTTARWASACAARRAW